MAAVELEWIPETLYNTAISAVVDNYSRSRRDIRSLPENIQFDVYYKVRPERSRRSADGVSDSRGTPACSCHPPLAANVSSNTVTLRSLSAHLTPVCFGFLRSVTVRSHRRPFD